jgi:CheY-like chemotaxis protein
MDDIQLLADAISEFTTACFLKFTNSEQAINTLVNNSTLIPVYIFTDYNMPLVNGEQVIRTLRQQPMFRKTIIVALSTSMSGDLAQSLKTAGADFALKKPVSIKEFSVMLESIFNTPNTGSL